MTEAGPIAVQLEQVGDGTEAVVACAEMLDGHVPDLLAYTDAAPLSTDHVHAQVAVAATQTDAAAAAQEVA